MATMGRTLYVTMYTYRPGGAFSISQRALGSLQQLPQARIYLIVPLLLSAEGNFTMVLVPRHWDMIAYFIIVLVRL